MAWQSPHIQRSSAVESIWPTAADRCSAGHELCFDELLDAALWGRGAHRANRGPWHQHLDQLVKPSDWTDLDRTWLNLTSGASCGSGVPQLLLLLDFVRIHVGHWCETSSLSETFTLGQQLTFEGFLAIVLQCFCNLSYLSVQYHGISCDIMW